MPNERAVPTELNARQALFVSHYITGVSGTEAAIKAGYSLDKNGAKAAAWRLLHCFPAVMKAVAEAQARVQEAWEITAESMIKEFDANGDFAIKTENATAACRASEL